MAESVAVVGLGRIGLPLALTFADAGLSVIGVDRDQGRLDAIEAGTMPVEETGTQALLERVNEGGRLRLSKQIEDAAEADHIVLTIGTPAFAQIEIDIS